MTDDGADDSQQNPTQQNLTLADETLMNCLADMLSEENTPPPLVMELARQSFGLRAIDAELASLTADSEVIGTASAVRRAYQADAPRLLTFNVPGLVIELEISGSGTERRVFGELTPHGSMTIEVRQPDSPAPRFVDADDDGRFVIESLLSGPLSLICHRLGHSPVTTEWTSVS